MSDPLGIMDCVQRDLQRMSGAAPLPLPLPAQRTAPLDNPRTPGELLSNLPAEVSQTAQAGADILANLPGRLMEDVTAALSNLVRVPREVGQELVLTPGKLAQRLAPSNINRALETIRESADFKSAGSPKELRERMRTITDVVDLFTPT